MTAVGLAPGTTIAICQSAFATFALKVGQPHHGTIVSLRANRREEIDSFVSELSAHDAGFSHIKTIVTNATPFSSIVDLQ